MCLREYACMCVCVIYVNVFKVGRKFVSMSALS